MRRDAASAGRSTSAAPGRTPRADPRCAARALGGLLGAPVPTTERSAAILDALDFDVADAPDGLDVDVAALAPRDVTREADLIEEVARLDGAREAARDAARPAAARRGG